MLFTILYELAFFETWIFSGMSFQLLGLNFDKTECLITVYSYRLFLFNLASGVVCRDGNLTNRQLMRSVLGRLMHLLTFWSQICSFDCVVEGD